MKAAVAKQPVSVGISSRRMFDYESGIFNDPECGVSSIDHATLVVGYGSENGTEYWIMKNSWKSTWGEEGYMRLEIQQGAGICRIQEQVNYPITNDP